MPSKGSSKSPASKGSPCKASPYKAPRVSKFVETASDDMPDLQTTFDAEGLYKAVINHFKHNQALAGKQLKDKVSRFLSGKSIAQTDIIAFRDHLKELKLQSAGRRDKFRDNLELAIQTMLVSCSAFFYCCIQKK
jgi:hypothetical protein